MPRPILARVDLTALQHNHTLLRQCAGQAKVWVVAKANGYGHGLIRVARTLRSADGFAVLDLNDAVRLREAGVGRPILLLEGFFEPRDIAVIADYRLHTVIHSAEQVEMLERTVLRAPVDVYLKMNTGMNRLGFAPIRYGDVVRRLNQRVKTSSITFMTHFADADGARGIADQLARFELGMAGLAGEISVANSAALLRYPKTHCNWVRPGLALYGCSPFADETATSIGLKPVMQLKSKLIAVQDLVAGERIGYGGSFVATESMRIGIVACGYADGYPRHAPTGTPVIVGGMRTATVGRVSMDMLAVDLTRLREAHVGSDVTLWGPGLSADEVAAAAGTVSYELLTALAPRVPVEEFE